MARTTERRKVNALERSNLILRAMQNGLISVSVERYEPKLKVIKVITPELREQNRKWARDSWRRKVAKLYAEGLTAFGDKRKNVQHKDLAVVKGRQSAGVDVEVRVYLYRRNMEPQGL